MRPEGKLAVQAAGWGRLRDPPSGNVEVTDRIGKAGREIDRDTEGFLSFQ